jgi:ABC-type Fe3+/spermidine/putrescine transport system ATPase subunit
MASDPLPLRLREVSKSFSSVRALEPVSLDVRAGEFVTLLGPSGSGKTTLLNITAGYIAPDTGSLWIGEVDVTEMPARKRNIGMVFQNYALFPHFSVFENVAYGLRVRRVASDEVRRRVEQALRIVRLEGYGPRAINQLSGGQQQRVALARAIIIEPAVLLMDEPLGALDRQLRKHVQLEIRRLHRELGRTTLYVTHDQEEALVLSDRIGVMRDGWIEQIGTPDELYRRPANAFVAGFLGESNLLHGHVTRADGRTGFLAAPTLAIELAGECAPDLRPGQEAVALVRPEAVELTLEFGEGLPGRVAEVVYLGELLAIRVVLSSGQDFWCRCFSRVEIPAEGREVRLRWRNEDVRLVPLASSVQKEI